MKGEVSSMKVLRSQRASTDSVELFRTAAALVRLVNVKCLLSCENSTSRMDSFNVVLFHTSTFFPNMMPQSQTFTPENEMTVKHVLKQKCVTMFGEAVCRLKLKLCLGEN